MLRQKSGSEQWQQPLLDDVRIGSHRLKFSVSGVLTVRPECELGLGCMYSSPSACFSALHTFQAFGNSEKPTRNNGLRGALAVE